MGIVSEVDKIEQDVYLPTVLKILGAVVLGITVWKGVHGFFPTTGVLVGGAMLLVGGMFNKIYK